MDNKLEALIREQVEAGNEESIFVPYGKRLPIIMAWANWAGTEERQDVWVQLVDTAVQDIFWHFADGDSAYNGDRMKNAMERSLWDTMAPYLDQLIEEVRTDIATEASA